MADITLNGIIYKNVQKVKYNEKEVKIFKRNNEIIWQEPINMEDVSTTLGNNSWEIISHVSQLGRAQEYWKIGDAKSITYNSKTYNARIIAFNADTLTSDTNKTAGITFWIENSLFSMALGDAGASTYGWETSNARKFFLSESFLDNLDSSLKNCLLEVNKKSYYNNSINTTSDKLFLLSLSEIVGTSDKNLKEEGAQYNYFTTSAFVPPTSNSWTRTFQKTNSDGQHYYYYLSGNSFNQGSVYAERSIAIRPGFCV